MSTIGNLLSKINLDGRWSENEPLADHTTFRLGGPADAMVFPASRDDVVRVDRLARDEGLPLFVMGRGANLVVADRGIRGITLNVSSLNAILQDGEFIRAEAGADVSAVARFGLERERSCLEFLHAMPSSVGGAVFMNARCYGAEVADVFFEATVLSEGRLLTRGFNADEWSYKRSPFQQNGIILEAVFRTRPALKDEIEAVMTANASDREEKGHFLRPCAGSIFKNNHEFGAPSGVLIDRAGLKGLRRGGAAVSAWHGNILINDGGATASDLRRLIDEVRTRVAEQTGFVLEEEVVYAGDWGDWPASYQS